MYRGLLCADTRCTAPIDIDIRVDDWNGAGDNVRVAVGETAVAVVYPSGFNNNGGVVLATVPIAQLGVGTFVEHTVYGES